MTQGYYAHMKGHVRPCVIKSVDEAEETAEIYPSGWTISKVIPISNIIHNDNVIETIGKKVTSRKLKEIYMVAINFTKFVEKVEAREKRMTIRKTRRAEPGDKIQLYTHMRRKTCRKLVEEDATLSEVCQIWIDEEGITFGDGYAGSLSGLGSEEIANMDGFQNFRGMKLFFRKQYGYPFTGYVHIWDWPD